MQLTLTQIPVLPLEAPAYAVAPPVRNRETSNPVMNESGVRL